jgi:hypothetical protein
MGKARGRRQCPRDPGRARPGTVRPQQTGHGYATEAVGALLDLSFNNLGLRRVTTTCIAANDASWRLMERVGMPRDLHRPRVPAPLRRMARRMGYALLAEDTARALPPTSDPQAPHDSSDARRAPAPLAPPVR